MFLSPTHLDVTTTGAAHGTVRVAAVGEIDMGSAPRLHRAVLDALVGRPAVVEVDLAGVTFMDSSGINILVACRQGAGDARVRVVNAAPQVLRVLTVTGLAAVLGLSPAG
ncbi:STAS domain-containing protein [Spirilliplanes yamanashiensis]|uniref:Anti-sigma factor antagonist n=1 Tax=Spirilliplanes yamanashiensis TaxID=42233 RepID=A0A8J3Y9T4_9ACTN|nr:STAS domain-containing protein [Spirilliplanes yamanashiensis]MDP9815743.1 anti-sigma B factor antagonist [Spirilliplanes yamanashiensis]GIJ03997.1 anti-sigma factor antagonist [Spirilliplanes yamanashiensis]